MMKNLSLLNNIKNLPKKFFALTIALLVAVIATSSLGIAATEVTLEGWTKSLNVTTGETQYKDATNLKVDEVAQIQLWQHNREAPGGKAAENTVVKFAVPTTAGKAQKVTGTTTSDNGNTITDSTDINLSLDKAKLQYIPGTAKFRYNKGAVDGVQSCITGMEYPAESCYATVTISDEVIRGGVNLDQIRKTPLHGCNAYHETVTIQVRAVADVVSVNKYVRHVGQGADGWKTSTTAKPGDDLEYLIRFKNEGNTQLNNVMVGDNLPKYNAYVNDTTMLQNGNHPDGTKITNNNITKGGINVGNYTPGSVGYVWFRVDLDPATAYEKCGEYEVVNVGVVRPEGMNEFYNTASVKINVECDEQPVVVTQCVSLTAQKLSFKVGESTELTAQGYAENATVTGYIFQVDGKEVQNSTSNKYTFTSNNAGEYKIATIVKFSNGDQKTSENCEIKITVVEDDKPVYSCDSFVLTMNNRTANVSFIARSSGGATFKNATIVYSADGVTKNTITTDQIANDGKVVSNYTFDNAAKNVNAVATVRFNVGNDVKEVDCRGAAVLGVTTTPTPPTTPTVLPNTGAGSVAGILAAVAAIGAYAHRALTLKRQ